MFGINLRKKIAVPNPSAPTTADQAPPACPAPEPNPAPSGKPEPSNAPNTPPPPAAGAASNPEPLAVDSLPITPPSLPIPKLNNPYPLGPIHQPEGTIPILNKNGLILGWAPRDPKTPNGASDQECVDQKSKIVNPPSPDAIAFYNRQGEIVCWFDRHRLVPGATDETPVRGTPHNIPVLSRSGRIIGWSKDPEGLGLHRPSPAAIPLIAQYALNEFAWLDESLPPDPRS
jgi:hypothetical protein